MALRDVTVAYCRIAIARKHQSVSAFWSGKIKAVVQGGGAILLTAAPLYLEHVGQWPPAAISWIIIAVTAVSALEYISAAISK
jgi:phosphatidylglycerophosphate synthase